MYSGVLYSWRELNFVSRQTLFILSCARSRKDPSQIAKVQKKSQTFEPLKEL